MKAIEILKGISTEIDSVFETVEDFARWTPVKSDIEFKISDNKVIAIDYSIESREIIKANLSLYCKKSNKWDKETISHELKLFGENSFCELLRLRFDELFEKEELERQEAELQIQLDEKEHRDMSNTYYSLQYYR